MLARVDEEIDISDILNLILCWKLPREFLLGTYDSLKQSYEREKRFNAVVEEWRGYWKKN